jgi:enediyne biosynthesis thioesterase
MIGLERTHPAEARADSTGHSKDKKPAYLHRHVVSFEETNVIGNVYFTRHVSWQGRCREMFLKTHAPGILDEIRRDLRLVTLKVSCEYFSELHAFDEIEIRMRLAFLRQHRIGLDFDYLVASAKSEQLAARGFQEIGCMRHGHDGLCAVEPPAELMDALLPYAVQ